MEIARFTLDWLTTTFPLGLPISSTVAAYGQTNPRGVLRVHTEHGYFAIKQYGQPPRGMALTIEEGAYQARFPMPDPLYALDGSRVATCTNDNGQQIWILASNWIEGEPYEWHIVDPGISVHMGALLARMHQLPTPKHMLQETSWSPLGHAGWAKLAEQAMAKEVEWAHLLLEKIDALVAWEEFIQAHSVSDEPLVPSQRDLHPPNVIRRTSGGHAVVDWDAAGPVLAREEVAMFAFVWATDQNSVISPTAVRAFIEGYRDAGGQYASRGIFDLAGRERSRMAWLAYNVQRQLDTPPGPNPWLPSALLSGVQEPQPCLLNELSALLQQ
jgi:hypothetical protein